MFGARCDLVAFKLRHLKSLHGGLITVLAMAETVEGEERWCTLPEAHSNTMNHRMLDDNVLHTEHAQVERQH